MKRITISSFLLVCMTADAFAAGNSFFGKQKSDPAPVTVAPAVSAPAHACPDWVQVTPEGDADRIFFVGVGQASTEGDARNLARTNAARVIAEFLGQKIASDYSTKRTESGKSLADELRGSAEHIVQGAVAKEFHTDREGAEYKVYALMEAKRQALASGLQKIVYVEPEDAIATLILELKEGAATVDANPIRPLNAAMALVLEDMKEELDGIRRIHVQEFVHGASYDRGFADTAGRGAILSGLAEQHLSRLKLGQLTAINDSNAASLKGSFCLDPTGDFVRLAAYIEMPDGTRAGSATARLAKRALGFEPKLVVEEPKKEKKKKPAEPKMEDVAPEVANKLNPAATDPYALRVKVTTERGEKAVYRAGENVVLYVTASRECYAHVVYFQADGTVVQLFPNPLTGDLASGVYLKGGQTYRIPDEGAFSGFHFEVQPPFGIESIKVYAASVPFSVKDLARQSGDFLLHEAGRADADKAIRTRGLAPRPGQKVGDYAEGAALVTTVSK